MDSAMGPQAWAADALRRAVEAASWGQPLDAGPVGPRSPSTAPHVVYSSDPGRFPRTVGFRLPPEVTTDMSPVIYRPGRGDDPEHPRRGRRAEVPPLPEAGEFRPSIAGPGVPTAGGFADGMLDGFDEDPDISDDELVDAADDALLDALEAERRPAPAARPPRTKAQRTPPPPPVEIVESSAQPPRWSPPKPRYRPVDSTPAAPAPVEPIDDAPAVEDRPAAPRAPRVRTLHISAPPTGPAPARAPEPEPEVEVEVAPEPETTHDRAWRDAAPRIGRPRPVAPVDLPAEADPSPVEPEPFDLGVEVLGSVEGHVVSSHGRGLSGLTVSLLDTDGEVVAAAISGRHGEYEIADVPRGRYRVVASDDEDGAYADLAEGSAVTVDGDVEHDLMLRTAAVILAEVDVRRRKAVIEIEVTDRASGSASRGTVVVSTDQFATELPLVKGETRIAIYGSADEWGQGVPRLPKRVRVEYRGSKHTAPATRTVKLR